MHRIAINRYMSRAHILQLALDDPQKVVKVIASDGKTAETRELCYTNCKVVGNGSFGVVFQAKLVGPPNDGEDVAIKKVLQDKRFKVSFVAFACPRSGFAVARIWTRILGTDSLSHLMFVRTGSFKLCGLYLIPTWST